MHIRQAFRGASGITRFRFRLGRPGSRTTPRECCDTHCDWMVHEAASKPSPSQFELPSTLVKSGGTFSTANPKSDVEVKVAAGAKTPGPGQYFHGGGASQDASIPTWGAAARARWTCSWTSLAAPPALDPMTSPPPPPPPSPSPLPPPPPPPSSPPPPAKNG